MRVARCSYVSRLLPPVVYVDTVTSTPAAPCKAGGRPLPTFGGGRRGFSRAIGTGRSALEAWVHSHPFVSPCDVYPDMFLWGWTYLPTLEENEMWTPQLKAAPRFPLQRFWEPAIPHGHYATNQLDFVNWFGD